MKRKFKGILLKRNLIREFCKKHGIVFLGIFGSFARNEAKDSSDVDILIKFDRIGGLLEFIKTENDLGDLFGRKVDLVTEKALHPLLRDRILKDVTPIYERYRER
ncbi:MAG: nucleotidyltransferase family protein [bacterium]